MRLLHLGENKRLLTTDFSGQTIPPYAILSHRWGKDEVLLEDLDSTKCEMKSGYRKVEFCAEQGARHGLEYFWIDSCCIDKYYRAERSKAINSMYRWYRDAARCYVFLQDVTAPTVEPAQHDSWEAQLKASDWFTRGWTLQELLAPASVEFYSSSGQSLGTRESLKQLIHDVTSIPIEALQGRRLDGFSIRDRMAWAHTRRTTQPEDYAYCQIGILNVHLHLDYGEGRERALSRLQEEVEAVGATPCSMPYYPHEPFLDRQLQLTQIEARLFTSKHTTNIIITGEGGTGKSRLALELAHRIRRKDRRCSVFWVDASSIDSLNQAFTNIAQKLDIPGWDDVRVNIRHLIKHHLSDYRTGSWLLVFDNADELKLRSTVTSLQRSTSLTECLPDSPLGSILFTANNSYLAEHLSAPCVVELKAMTADHAEQMLLTRLLNPTRAGETKELKLLVEELARVPQAIVQAAAYINIRDIELEEYRALITARKEVVRGLSSVSSDRAVRGCDTMNPIISTLLVTIDHLHQYHSLAAEVLFLAACIDPKDILVELLSPALPNEREDSIATLKAYGVVTRRPAESALELHGLAQFAVQSWLDEQGWLPHWVQQAVQRLLEIFPHSQQENDLGYRSKWRRLWPHVKRVLSHCPAGEDDEGMTTLVWRLAHALVEDGRDEEAEEMFLRVKDTRVRVLGPDHPDTLTSMSNLAHVFYNQKRWEDAEKLDVELLDTRVRVLGPDHRYTLHSKGNLAANYSAQGRFKEAEDLEIQVKEARERKFGTELPETLQAMSNLANTYCFQGRWKEAEGLEMRVWDVRRKLLGQDHPDTVTSLSNLATIYINLDQLSDALRFRTQVRDVRMRLLGVEHQSTLKSMVDLAYMYLLTGDKEKARGLYAEVEATRQRVLRVGHPDTLDTMSDLAYVLWKMGKRTEAVTHMEDCVRIGQRNMDKDNPALIRWSTTLARYQADCAEVSTEVKQAEPGPRVNTARKEPRPALDEALSIEKETPSSLSTVTDYSDNAKCHVIRA